MTRARLLAAAEEMFLARGFAGTAVDAVAHAAGYTTGAVYSNFGGKADLFLAVLEHATAAQLAATRAALAEAKTDEQRLEVFSTAMAAEPQWQARVAATLEFLSHARGHPDLLGRLRAAQHVADEATAELITALYGALGVDPPVDVDAVTRDVIALMAGLAVRSLFDDQFDMAASLPRAINSLLAGDRSALQSMRVETGVDR